MLLTITCANGQQHELSAGGPTGVADLKATLDRRGGTVPGRAPLYRLATSTQSWRARQSSKPLPEETRLLRESIMELPPDSRARSQQLVRWLDAVDTRVSGDVVQMPSLLHDAWSLERCGLTDGDHLYYGPWLAEVDGAGIVQRTGRTAVEQCLGLRALVAMREVGKTEADATAQPEPELTGHGDTEPGAHASFGAAALAVVASHSSGAGIRALSDKLGQLLRQAAHRGFKDEVVKQLDAGSPVDEPSERDGCTALMIAATRGVAACGSGDVQPQQSYNDVLTLLLARGADPNKADRRGWTAMHKAASVGNLFAIRAMRANRPVARQGLPNQQDRKGWTCLHWAKTAEVAKVLLEMGAKDDIKNGHSMTPEALHYKRAATNGTSSVAEFFATRRAEIDKNKKPWED